MPSVEIYKSYLMMGVPLLSTFRSRETDKEVSVAETKAGGFAYPGKVATLS
jgi:hypothetical protein